MRNLLSVKEISSKRAKILLYGGGPEILDISMVGALRHPPLSPYKRLYKFPDFAELPYFLE